MLSKGLTVSNNFLNDVANFDNGIALPMQPVLNNNRDTKPDDQQFLQLHQHNQQKKVDKGKAVAWLEEVIGNHHEWHHQFSVARVDPTLWCSHRLAHDQETEMKSSEHIPRNDWNDPKQQQTH